MYEADSINKVNFVKGVGNRKHFLLFHLFQGNQWWWVLLCLRTLSAWPYLLTTAPRINSLLEWQCVSTPWNVYSFTFFKEINSDEFFHVLEHGQHDLLYWPLQLELILFLECQCVSIPWTVFLTQANDGISV